MTHPLITASELADLLAGERPPRLMDVRWSLGGEQGRPAFEAGHLPGAVFADLDAELAAPPDPAHGRHPLPSLEQLQSAARSWGLNDGDAVVVYDEATSASAARLWWLLRDAGASDVRVLDGGLRQWQAAGEPIESGRENVASGTITLHPGEMAVVDADAAAALAHSRDGILLDARAPERYRGEVEPIDPRAGHIPGARNAPFAENLTAEGRFRPTAELREHYARLGVHEREPVGVYCGSGITASHDVLALAVAGIDAALYPGSWSQWSNDPDRQVATGPLP